MLSLLKSHRINFIKKSSTTVFSSKNYLSSKETKNKKSLPLEPHLKKTIEEIVRVNHAGEYGAVRIYQGQIAVLKGTKEEPTLQHFLEQEKSHLRGCNESLERYRSRPSLLMPFWDIAGYALGAFTATLGKDAAMACTEAVETVISDHYNDQLRMLHEEKYSDFKELRAQIKKNRDDEIEHLEKSQEEGAKNV